MKALEQQILEFKALSDIACDALGNGESLILSLSSEHQHYARFNRGLTRQIIEVEQQKIRLEFMAHGRRLLFSTDLSSSIELDRALLLNRIERARAECRSLPEDPHGILPEDQGYSEERHETGSLPEIGDVCRMIFDLSHGQDLAGLYAGGDQLRMTANSEKTFHAFSNRSFFLDYSLYTQNAEGEPKALKALYAGKLFSEGSLTQHLSKSFEKLPPLRQRPRKISPGRYRVYLAPAAVASLIEMFSWDAVSLGALRRGESAFSRLESGAARLSALFSLAEDFSLGLHPRFNSDGKLAPYRLPVIEEGQLRNLLVHDRSAVEYGIPSNGASAAERLRSPRMAQGSLHDDDILGALGNGLYISNLHYLNWSDRQGGRITGMTRFACFWVENGALAAPIEDLRFDESLYHIFGQGLEAVGANPTIRLETQTYHERQLGGMEVSGCLVDGFHFTL